MHIELIKNNLGDLPAASYYLDKVSEHIEKHFGLNDE